MSNSDRVRDRDISELLKLANELHELAPNHAERYEHMLHSMTKLLGADVAVALLGCAGPRSAPERFDVCTLAYHGLDDPEKRHVANDYFRTMMPANPVRVSLVKLSMRESPATYRREELVEDRKWYRSAYFQQRHQAMGLDHSVHSVKSFHRSRLVSVIGVYREQTERRQFTERERSLLRLFHSQAQWMYECAPRGTRSPVTVVLSAREKQTLRLLLGGDSEKQIATKLGLSQRSVHENVKTIYRTIEVASRGELLAKFVRRAKPRSKNGFVPPN